MTLTPEQFNKLATKDDLQEMKKEMVTKNEHNDVMSAIDAVMHKLDIIEHAFVSNQAAHNRFEQRITRIEQHLNLKPA
ncbi:hypothetical protein COX22_02225 [Candidatus Falkowbacteria bacterium CG23_combo_of_CG06-09_8_20_14_all_49_15]|uniref:Uncharacterized protein n=1 Tax=Candidatus Falkowbacteria bacterium CG23_combo_of_CG06-09_8_20_14_all_49_15 TaxID=1974572 RepID=A0A2G9ZKZ0_9BACT|nr:MAG: hypothetical protein COX22_02225 [Candidatus Falkowbacteria bacterium CG23_combo_of_CG06-09_8_20_14_all_49_15]